jgi:uncharacterized protein (DUF1330 family)
MQVVNQVMPTPELAQPFFFGDGVADHGPMVMVNLLKFKPKADYADGSDADLTGRDAYLRYGAAVQACLAKVGGRALYSGPVTGIILGEVDELWDMVALAEYPSVQAMMDMVALPEYRAIEHHRLAGLAGQLNIRTRPLSRP